MDPALAVGGGPMSLAAVIEIVVIVVVTLPFAALAVEMVNLMDEGNE